MNFNRSSEAARKIPTLPQPLADGSSRIASPITQPISGPSLNHHITLSPPTAAVLTLNIGKEYSIANIIIAALDTV